MADKLWFQKDGKDIENGIEVKCTKALPFGGECYDVYHDGIKIGEILYGEPHGEMLTGYSWRIDKDQPSRDSAEKV